MRPLWLVDDCSGDIVESCCIVLPQFVYDGRANHSPYSWMYFRWAGWDLMEIMMHEELRNKHYGCEWSRNVVCDIETGVDTLHSIGVIHGDIKMENVLYDPGSNRSKIIDFDGACIFDVHSGDMQYPVGIEDMCRLKTTWASMSHMRLEDPFRTPSTEDDKFRIGMIVYTLITQELFCLHEEPCDSWMMFVARTLAFRRCFKSLGEEQRSRLPVAVKRARRKLNTPDMAAWDTQSWVASLQQRFKCFSF